MSAWPDPERPGWPLNPERDGWHMLCRNCPQPLHWHSRQQAWQDGVGDWWEPHQAARWDYMGPWVSPSEVAVALAHAVKQEREACATICDARARAVPMIGDDWGHGPEEAKRIAAAIRAQGGAE